MDWHASAAGGGLFGLVGTALGRVAAVVERRQENRQARARWAHELALEQARRETGLALAQAQTEETVEQGRWDGLAASIAADAAIGPTYHWVSAIRALTRPFLTLVLWLITVGIFIGAGPDERGDIVQTATFAATAATLWWFGDRGPRRS